MSFALDLAIELELFPHDFPGWSSSVVAPALVLHSCSAAGTRIIIQLATAKTWLHQGIYRLFCS